MSNAVLPTITIDLTLDRQIPKLVLTGVLHAILFHRLFGLIKPKVFEIQDVTMPGISDPDTEQLVNDKVDALWRAIEGGPVKKGQIVVTLSEKRAKPKWFFAQGEEEVPWEQWIINAEIRHSMNDPDYRQNLSTTLTKSVETMIKYTTSEQGRSVVPLISDASGISPFPFKIVSKVGNVEVG